MLALVLMALYLPEYLVCCLWVTVSLLSTLLDILSAVCALLSLGAVTEVLLPFSILFHLAARDPFWGMAFHTLALICITCLEHFIYFVFWYHPATPHACVCFSQDHVVCVALLFCPLPAQLFLSVRLNVHLFLANFDPDACAIV